MKEPETFAEAVDNLKQSFSCLIRTIDEEFKISFFITKFLNWIIK